MMFHCHKSPFSMLIVLRKKEKKQNKNDGNLAVGDSNLAAD